MNYIDKNLCFYCGGAGEVLIADEILGTILRSCPRCSYGSKHHFVPQLTAAELKAKHKAVMDHVVEVTFGSYARMNQRTKNNAKSS